MSLPEVSREDIDEVLRRKDLGFFAEDVLGMEISGHHEEWSDLVVSHPRLGITASRDHGKSYMFTFAYPIWRLYYSWIPDLPSAEFKSVPRRPSGYIFSSNQPNAIRMLDDIKTEIEVNPKLNWLKPPNPAMWSKNEIRCTNGATLRARGWGVSVRGGHPAWAICQPLGTDVLTGVGMKKIEDLRVGDFVLTHRGRWRKISKIGRRRSELIGYKLSGSHDYEWATPEHKFWNGSEFVLPKEGDWLEAPVDNRVPEDVSYNEDFCRLIGLWLGDGTLYRAKNGNYVKHGAIIYVSKHESEIDKIAIKAGVIPCWSDGKTCKRMQVNGREIYDLFSTMKVDGNSQKVVPDWVENLPKNKLEAVVHGYWLADGCFTKSKDKVGEYRITSVSLPLLKSMQRILSKLGITSNIRVLRDAKKMEIEGRIVNCQKTYDLRIGWEFGRIVGSDYKPERIVNNKRQVITDGVIRRKVVDVVRSEETEVVSFTVEEDHSYTGHLICSHNCDDVLDDESMYSEQRRMKDTEYFYSAITPMVIPGGQIIVVGTPMHQEDLYNSLRDNPKYRFASFPAIKENGEALWPTRYSLKMLNDKKEEVGSTRFSREYLVIPVSDEASLFPEKILKENYDHECSLVTNMTDELHQHYQVYVGVDLAMSASVGADYTVVTVIGVDQFKNRRILDIRRFKGKGFRDQLREIEDVYFAFRPQKILIEDNQMQRVFRDELIRYTDMPVEGFTTTAHNKNSLERGVPSLQVLFENKKFIIPRKTERDRRITDMLLSELKNFTFVNGKLQGLGTHDDTVMSLWFANEASQSATFRFSFA